MTIAAAGVPAMTVSVLRQPALDLHSHGCQTRSLDAADHQLFLLGEGKGLAQVA
jgi:hypothetical protein